MSYLEAVVRIKSSIPGSSSSEEVGTGWIVKREQDRAWIVTNRHVVSEEKSNQPAQIIQVKFRGGEELPAKIAHITSPTDSLDLAVLEVKGIPPKGTAFASVSD